MGLPEHPNNEPSREIPGYKPTEKEDRPFFLVVLGHDVDICDVFGPLMGVHHAAEFRALVAILDEQQAGVQAEVISDLQRSGFNPERVKEPISEFPLLDLEYTAIHLFDEPDIRWTEKVANHAAERGIPGWAWEEGGCSGRFGS